MRKILILAGLRVETELADPETIELISKVLSEFETTGAMDEDEMMFASRFQDFEKKKAKDMHSGGGRVRQKATKRVSEAYHLERAKKEKLEEIRLAEKRVREE